VVSSDRPRDPLEPAIDVPLQDSGCARNACGPTNRCRPQRAVAGEAVGAAQPILPICRHNGASVAAADVVIGNAAGELSEQMLPAGSTLARRIGCRIEMHVDLRCTGITSVHGHQPEPEPTTELQHGSALAVPYRPCLPAGRRGNSQIDRICDGARCLGRPGTERIFASARR